ncbi:MAG: hypothetical protein R6X25_09225 [Candidatus Krumholzibacteriia bacterium]
MMPVPSETLPRRDGYRGCFENVFALRWNGCGHGLSTGPTTNHSGGIDILIATTTAQPATGAHLRRTALLLLPALVVFLFAGCGARQVVVVPDYGNPHYVAPDLHRPQVGVVQAGDFRGNEPDRVGTAKVGVFNSEVPMRLTEPVSDFVARSFDTIVNAEPDGQELCPVTIRIEELSVGEHKGMFKEVGTAKCRLRFSFPVDPDSVRVVDVHATRTAGSMWDVTGSLEGILYESVADCMRQFIVDAYDPAPSRLVLDRARAERQAQSGPMAGSPPALARSSASSTAPGSPDAEERIWQRLSIDYHYFTNSEMRNAYPHGFGFTYAAGSDFARNFRQEFEVGLIAAMGTPVERPDTEWTIDSSSLFLLNLPIRYHLFYPPRGGRAGSFQPYLGVGVGGVIGIERMSADLSGGGNRVEVANGIFRSAYTGDVVVGGEINRWANPLVVELRFRYSGHNNVSEGLSDEEREERANTLYDALVRPNGEMTGVQLSVGMCW